MEKEAIMATLENYASAYCDKDIDALMKVFVDSDDISLIGTGADELCGGKDAVMKVFLRNFEEATAEQFEWHWSHITISGECAVVAITLTIHLIYQGEDLKVPIRWTVALRKVQGRWAWLHRHASSAASDQDEGAAYPKDQ
ncbi:MAG: nuclear transport factor 2 family protein [Pseudomonadota bacterium]